MRRKKHNIDNFIFRLFGVLTCFDVDWKTKGCKKHWQSVDVRILKVPKME